MRGKLLVLLVLQEAVLVHVGGVKVPVDEILDLLGAQLETEGLGEVVHQRGQLRPVEVARAVLVVLVVDAERQSLGIALLLGHERHAVNRGGGLERRSLRHARRDAWARRSKRSGLAVGARAGQSRPEQAPA